MKLLVVDDEKIVRIALSTIIDWSEHDFQFVGAASNGAEALKLIEQSSPDIIITDLKMPEMDGLELIRTLHERQYAGKYIVLSNYDEYASVREAMRLGASDYMLKMTIEPSELLAILQKLRNSLLEERKQQATNNQLVRQLHESQNQQRIQLLKEYLQESDLIADTLERDIKAIGFHDAAAIGRLLLIHMSEYENVMVNGKLRDKKLFLFSLENILKETLAGCEQIDLIELGEGLYLVIALDTRSASDDQKWLLLAGKTIQLLAMYLNIHLSVTLSSQFSGIHALREQYLQALLAASADFYEGPDVVIEASKMVITPYLASDIELDWSEKLKLAVEEGNVERLEEVLANIIAYATEVKWDPASLKRYYIALLGDLDKEYLKWEQQYTAVLAEDMHAVQKLSLFYFEALTKAATVEEFMLAAQKALQSACSRLQDMKDKRYRKEVLQLIELIEHNTDKKMSLEQLASEVNMHANYMCRVFKQDTGKSIVQYWNELKISKAAEYLKQPDVRVKEAAAYVGIDDPFYFNRLFKKIIGISPTEYRNKYI